MEKYDQKETACELQSLMKLGSVFCLYIIKLSRSQIWRNLFETLAYPYYLNIYKYSNLRITSGKKLQNKISTDFS